ncbi:MEKHLA domain-containing protein [Nitrosomonas oligotropha]|uniref:MEKHLA domain-containing protein n=1 Tax=Nitrosomonas oligotropha TaxID=42354 RepID=A0A1H8UU62_9PROT|nr:MEKHLA domain-containing protein [Nitrosomonas oligotropha]SDX49019.1 MEKHLA domain-containing protein [Nitrosomonas oligotropha]SEP06709.1 MEKHLA domain-containing protein [Nitrosomonas oligotropha]
MQTDWTHPDIVQWCQYLLDSYAHWVKQELIERTGTPLEQAERLFNSAFVVASHGTEDDPILNYGNRTALNLWMMDWQQFTHTPSRLTAEPAKREERARMLEQVKTQGYHADYSGIRISSTGKRFLAERILIWNIQKPDGTIVGQGATFSTWKFLSQN